MTPSLFFDYELPDHCIAQQPAQPRTDARLMLVDRMNQVISHHRIRELPQLLQPGDLLVFNNSKVVKARLFGKRAATGGRWEGLFLRELEPKVWEMLATTRGYPQLQELFTISEDFHLKLVGRTADRHWLMQPNLPDEPWDLLQRYGSIPLPPYIRAGVAGQKDEHDYQTIFAQEPGSVAAPTAGLHFTTELLEQLQAQGIDFTTITLHVGLGTFAPIKANDPKDHPIHREITQISEQACRRIQKQQQQGQRIIAVGTTTVRTLEGAATSGTLTAGSGETALYITPPFDFQIISGMITNFHLPRTTLLLLVQAWSGSDLLRQAYEEAIQRDYRFYSYGDAMLIL